MGNCETPKKQHYVPQYYLKRFAGIKGKLWVYDQKQHSMYQSRVNDVCEKNYHYEMEAIGAADWHGRHLLPGKIEGGLSKIESEQSKLLREIDRQLQSGYIHEKERRSLCWLVAHLIARHPAMLEGPEPDRETIMEDPAVRWGLKILEQMGAGDEIDTLARGANQVVLALWRCKDSPTYFIQKDLQRLHCWFIAPEGEARFITSSFPPHLSTSTRKDGRNHIDDLTLPLSSTLAVVYAETGPKRTGVQTIPDKDVIGLNARYFASYPFCEQIISDRKYDLQQAQELWQSWMLRSLQL